MRLYNEHTEPYLQALATSAGKDPASLEAWQCVHMMTDEEVPRVCIAQAIAKTMGSYASSECDVIHCADNDVLLISRELSVASLQDLAHYIMQQCQQPDGADINVYDMFHDWRAIRAILTAKVPPLPMPIIEPSADTPYSFGETESLKAVFTDAAKRRPGRQPLHVMIVEDDALTRRLISNAFKERYALISAGSAEEAVANYLLHAPDIVFLDIGLPDVNGFHVLKQIIASDPDAYVVMFSGHSYLDNITKALNTGASGFVAKPFRKEKLVHYIQNSAAHHRKCSSA